MHRMSMFFVVDMILSLSLLDFFSEYLTCVFYIQVDMRDYIFLATTRHCSITYPSLLLLFFLVGNLFFYSNFFHY